MNKIVDTKSIKYIFSNSLEGNCNSCGASLSSGGFFAIEESGNIIQLLCGECKEILELTATTKKSKITLRKLYGFLHKGYYMVLSSQNLVIFSRVIEEEQVRKYVENPNIDVTVKYE